jgi:hypothetical protein
MRLVIASYGILGLLYGARAKKKIYKAGVCAGYKCLRIIFKILQPLK